MQCHVRNTNFQGIMGLSHQATNDLFLADGTYTLWNKDIVPETGGKRGDNSYSSHPFFMAAANNDAWFGVYQNVANA